MNQKNGMAWRLTAIVGAAGLAIGTASAGDAASPTNENTAENIDATIRMLHEASFVTPAVDTFGRVAAHELLPEEVTLAACFDSAAPPSPEVMAAVNQFMLGASRYQTAGRWSGAQGSPRTLTWSFVRDGLSISGGVGEPTAPNVLFARFDTLFASQGGRATWINRFNQIFGRWDELSGLTHVRITFGGNDWDDGANWGTAGAAGLRGDCRIAAHNIDGGSGILAYNGYPTSGGDMVIDSSENWGNTSNQNRFLRNTLGHEHGHGVGIAHVCPSNNTKLMEPFLSTSFDGPRQDDVRAVQRHYGDPHEDDNTPATANDLGTVVVPSSTAYGTPPPPVAGTSDAAASTFSIDANSEVDYFKLTSASPAIVSVTVTPIGTTYKNAAQAGDGSCPAGTDFDALRAANLAVNVYQSDAITQLYDASAAASGVAETINNILLSDTDGGTAFVYFRVYETDAPTQTQLYRLTVNGISNPVIAASDDAFPDKVQVTWTNVVGETGYQIFRSTDTTLPGAPLDTVAADVASYDDVTAVPGTQYQYWVKATFAAGTPRMVGGPDAGRATFVPPTCVADLNEDGLVDFADYLEFLNRYDAGDLSVDFNGDGLVDFADYLEFLNLYEIGC